MNPQDYYQTASETEGDACARFSLTLQEWPFKGNSVSPGLQNGYYGHWVYIINVRKWRAIITLFYLMLIP